MGSKRSMLQNGLGDVILQEYPRFQRIVDLFSGSGIVAWFAATATPAPVLAVDLQRYSMILARSVIERTVPFDSSAITREWFGLARREISSSEEMRLIHEWRKSSDDLQELVSSARELCAVPVSELDLCWSPYGGHYFGPTQALILDVLNKTLPESEPIRTACHAALIAAASRCAASPGHTAQPFQPTDTALSFLWEAWERDPFHYVSVALCDIAQRQAQVYGNAIVADAVEVAAKLRRSDLVVVDPPYSAVQYSRFYHVLETVASGIHFVPEGVGRYPSLQLRPQSDFSKKTTSAAALTALLMNLAESGSTVIFTFPRGEASNGLSGELIKDTAGNSGFDVEQVGVIGTFSTLGGNNEARASRASSSELILVLRPRL